MSISIDVIAITGDTLSCSAVALLNLLLPHDTCEVVYLGVALQ